MQILGKVIIQGKEKELLLKEEDAFFKYYTLELIGAYIPQIKEQRIILKKDNDFTDELKAKINKLINASYVIEKVVNGDYRFQIIGEIEIDNVVREVLIKKEEEIFKYYYLNLIGIYTPKIPGQTIIFRQDTLENSVSADIKDNIQRRNINDLEKEQIEKFLQKIQILDIIDRMEMQERGIQGKSIKTNELGQKKHKQLNNTKTKNKVLQKQQTKQREVENKVKDINIKQEVEMDTRVTDMSNLEQVLKKSGKMPELDHGDAPLKMGIVESDDLKNLKNENGQKEQGHSSRYEAVVITKRGKVKALDLENDTQEGNNPSEKNYQVKQNDAVKQGDVLTRLKVGEGTIGIEKGQYGEVEVYHSPRKTIGGNGVEGNKSLDRQLETSNSKNTLEGTDIESLKLAQEYNDGYRSIEQGYQEVEKHKEEHPDCEPKSAKDLDGDMNTQSHTHETEDFVVLSSGEKVTYNDLATRWGFYKDGKPDGTYIKEKFTEKKQGEKSTEDVIEELDEEYEDPRSTGRGK